MEIVQPDNKIYLKKRERKDLIEGKIKPMQLLTLMIDYCMELGKDIKCVMSDQRK